MALSGMANTLVSSVIKEKTGIPRIKEALEANDWAQFPADNLSDFGDFTDPAADQKQAKDDDGKEFDPESLDFGYDRADFEGLKQAIWTSGMPAPDGDDDDADDKAKQTTTKEEEGSGGDAKNTGSQAAAAAAAETKTDLDDEDIEKVERMMRKLQAVREAGEGMGLEQRRRMAARAVEDVMREL
jgi:alpha- and gamma-adaptin-binding protein p34